MKLSAIVRKQKFEHKWRARRTMLTSGDNGLRVACLAAVVGVYHSEHSSKQAQTAEIKQGEGEFK